MDRVLKPIVFIAHSLNETIHYLCINWNWRHPSMEKFLHKRCSCAVVRKTFQIWEWPLSGMGHIRRSFGLSFFHMGVKEEHADKRHQHTHTHTHTHFMSIQSSRPHHLKRALASLETVNFFLDHYNTNPFFFTSLLYISCVCYCSFSIYPKELEISSLFVESHCQPNTYLQNKISSSNMDKHLVLQFQKSHFSFQIKENPLNQSL